MARKQRPEIEEEEIIYVSKTELKRDMEMLQQLGEKLVALPANQLEKVPLSESLLDAIELARSLRGKNEAMRRQLQFIGKLIKHDDHEAIEHAINSLSLNDNEAKAAQYYYEEMRQALINEGMPAINELISLYPHLDRQKLRQLVKNASAAPELSKTKKSATELFRYLRDEIDFNE